MSSDPETSESIYTYEYHHRSTTLSLCSKPLLARGDMNGEHTHIYIDWRRVCPHKTRVSRRIFHDTRIVIVYWYLHLHSIGVGVRRGHCIPFIGFLYGCGRMSTVASRGEVSCALVKKGRGCINRVALVGGMGKECHEI